VQGGSPAAALALILLWARRDQKPDLCYLCRRFLNCYPCSGYRTFCLQTSFIIRGLRGATTTSINFSLNAPLKPGTARGLPHRVAAGVWYGRGDGKKKTNGPPGADVRARPLSLSELRLGPQDRVTIRRRKSKENRLRSANRPTRTTPPPREAQSRSPGRGSKQAQNPKPPAPRVAVYRLFYWGARVLGLLGGGIAVVGVVVWVGAHLPAIQSLEIPKAGPPTIQITGLDGRRAGERAARWPASNVSA